jgi:hypothetical protein
VSDAVSNLLLTIFIVGLIAYVAYAIASRNWPR